MRLQTLEVQLTYRLPESGTIKKKLSIDFCRNTSLLDVKMEILKLIGASENISPSQIELYYNFWGQLVLLGESPLNNVRPIKAFFSSLTCYQLAALEHMELGYPPIIDTHYTAQHFVVDAHAHQNEDDPFGLVVFDF